MNHATSSLFMAAALLLSFPVMAAHEGNNKAQLVGTDGHAEVSGKAILNYVRGRANQPVVDEYGNPVYEEVENEDGSTEQQQVYRDTFTTSIHVRGLDPEDEYLFVVHLEDGSNPQVVCAMSPNQRGRAKCRGKVLLDEFRAAVVIDGEGAVVAETDGPFKVRGIRRRK